MRTLFAVLICPVWALASAPTSSVVVTAQGSAQTGRPLTISRIFAKGEIAGYAKPSIRGTGVPAVWQNDVRTRWRDGIASCNVTGATNTFPVKLTCVGHGYQEGDVVTVSGVGGNTAANGTWTILSVSTDTFELLNCPGNGTFTTGGTVSGPASGSLRHVLVSFRADVSTTTVDFLDDPDPCSAGSQAACNTAALDAAGMLAFHGGTWTATTETTASAIVHSASARTMLTAGKFRYWLRGPAVTQVIAGDEDRTYDWGYDCQGDGCYTTWTDDTVNRSLHPIFVLSFYAGWAGVKVEYIAENIWNNQLREMHYDLTLANSSGTVFSYTGYPHNAQTRWRRVYWDGSEPGGAGAEKSSVKIDLSTAYLVYVGVFPSYDLSLVPSEGTIAAYYGGFTTNQTNAVRGMACLAGTYCGSAMKTMNAGGGRDDLGVIPTWDSIYALTMDPRMRTVCEGNADLAGLIPVHARMLDSGGQYAYYDVANTVPKYWKYVGAHSQKTLGTTYIGAATGTNGWVWDGGHIPAMSYTAYVTGGEWFHLTNLYGAAHFISSDPLYVSKNQEYPNPYIALGINGIVILNNMGRYHAWPVREIGMAAFAAPDGTSEKNYLMNILLQNAGYIEGAFGIQGPLYSAKTTTPYNHYAEKSAWFSGSVAVNGSQANPLGFPSGNQSAGDVELFDPAVVPSGGYSVKVWAYYFIPIVYGFLARQFPFVVGAAEGSSRLTISFLGSGRPLSYAAMYNSQAFAADIDWPLLTAPYTYTDTILHVDQVPDWMQFPTVANVGGENVLLSAGDGTAKTLTIESHSLWWSGNGSAAIGAGVYFAVAFQDWTDWERGRDMVNSAAAWNAYAASNHMDFAGQDSYGTYAKAAAAYAYPYSANGWLGKTAWDAALADKVYAASDLKNNPKFEFKPLFDPVSAVATPGTTSVTLDYTKPVSYEACTVDGTSDGVVTSRTVQFVKTGLTAGSSGSLTIACASDPYGNTVVPYTTLSGDPAIGGATTLTGTFSGTVK